MLMRRSEGGTNELFTARLTKTSVSVRGRVNDYSRDGETRVGDKAVQWVKAVSVGRLCVACVAVALAQCTACMPFALT
jgi:hypothetical protein